MSEKAWKVDELGHMWPNLTGDRNRGGEQTISCHKCGASYTVSGCFLDKLDMSLRRRLLKRDQAVVLPCSV